MRPSRVTLAEVAARAGVSRTTASFVLSGRPDSRISAGARDRVLRAGRELNYRPNLMARSLRTKVTHTIALITDTIATEQYAGQMVYGSLAAAVAHDRMLFVAETEGDRVLEERLIQDLLDRQVDGFVYATMYTQRARIPAVLLGQPLVLLNCSTPTDEVSAVLPDEREAGRTAARALVEAGHRDGIYVVGEQPPHVFAGQERAEGIDDVLAGSRLALAGTVECSWWPESSYEAVTDFLREGGRPSAFICLNDRIAFGAYQALSAAGLSIPGDVSVVSFDDSDLATWVRPQLTSIALPHHQLGRRAVELLLSGDSGRGVERVEMPLRERASIGPPRAGAGATDGPAATPRQRIDAALGSP